MGYSVQIDRSINAFTYCMNKVNDEIYNIWDWRITVNAGGVDYGIYFNFDLEEQELEICNQPRFKESLYLDGIIEVINAEYEEEEED